MTKPSLLTDFNLTLSGSELVGIEWYRQAWKEKHLHFWNPNHPEYCQEFVDDITDDLAMDICSEIGVK